MQTNITGASGKVNYFQADLILTNHRHFYDARAALEPRIRELLEDYALRKIPRRSFEANALFLEIIRLAYNLVTAFQRLCLPESWQRLTLSKLRYKLLLLPGELTRPQNRPACGCVSPRCCRLWPTTLCNVSTNSNL